VANQPQADLLHDRKKATSSYIPSVGNRNDDVLANKAGKIKTTPHRDTHLHVLQLSADNAESVVARMVVDADLGDARGRPTRKPLLLGVAVNHDRSLGAHHRMLAAHSATDGHQFQPETNTTNDAQIPLGDMTQHSI